MKLALTLAEASASSGIPLETLRSFVKRGELAAVIYGRGRLRRRYLVLPADLEAWLLRHRVPADGEDGP